jgi:hypothetical protein
MKINFKKYLIFIALLLLLETPLYYADIKLFIGILIGLSGTIINNVMLIGFVNQFILEAPNKLKMTTLLLSKTVILFGLLSLSSLFMGNKVIIPVLNYVLIIFILYYSTVKKQE